MKIEKRTIKFEDGTEREMVVVDKESYELHLVTEADVGKTFKIFKNPLYLSVDQFEELKNTKF